MKVLINKWVNRIFETTFIFALIFPVLSFAECDKNLKSVASHSIAYRMRSNDRCEGFYESNVSSGSLNIVGVTKGKFKYKFDPKEVMTVSSNLKNLTVNVRATSIPLKTYYRMDTQILPNGMFQWPIKELLYPQGLKYSKICIFGWIKDQNEIIFIPLKVTSSLLSSKNNNNYYIYLRASIDIKKFKWRFSDGRWNQSKRKRIYEGTRIAFKIPQDKKNEIVRMTARAESVRGSELLICNAKILLKEEYLHHDKK